MSIESKTSASGTQSQPNTYDISAFPGFKSAGHFYLSRNESPSDWTTLVILGTGRSGTTMAAGVLMLLGVEFGDQTDQRLGDRDISRTFQVTYKSKAFWRVFTLRSRFSNVLQARLKRWSRYGFKSPDLAPFLPLLLGTIPRPVFIVATRNTFESSFGFADHVGGSWRRSYFTVTFLQLCLTLFTLVTRKPVLTFSYEAAAKDPGHFVDVLCGFLGLTPTADTRQNAVNHIDRTKGYRLLRRTNGHVDIATHKRLAGWVADAFHLTQGVEIEVRDGEGVLATTLAEGVRPDVKDAGFHRTGACGFDIAFEPPLTEEQLAGLSVIVSGSGHVFWTKSKGNR